MKKLKISLFIILTVLLNAQVQQSFTLNEITIEGNSFTSENIIRFTSGLKEGNEIQADGFSKAVKRLWELGIFSDVQVVFSHESEAGISIIIKVEENPALGKVVFKGNNKIKDRKFKEEFVFQRGMRIKPNFLSTTIRKIKDMYADDGYLLAEVTASLSEPSDDLIKIAGRETKTQDIIFKIKENKKVKIKKIVFSGNENLSNRKLRRKGLKETKKQAWYLFWRSNFDHKKYEEDLETLRQYYIDRGYRDFTILKDTLIYAENKKGLEIHLELSEGPQYKYRNFSWEGNLLYKTEVLIRALGLKSGSVFSQTEFDEAIYQKVQGLYMDRGYIYSQIEPRFTPVGDDSLDIHFSITENHQVTVRNINIYGNDKTRENVIRRELRIYPGDIFNRSMLERSARDLFILNYFGNIIPNVVPVDEDEIDLEISVEEKSSDKASASVGFTGIYGMTGGGSVEFNNFRGLGQILAISAQVGTKYSVYGTTPAKYQSFSFRFTDPMYKDSPNRIGFSLFYRFQGRATQYYLPLDMVIRGGSLEWGRRWRWPDDYFRGYWVLQAMRRDYEGSQEELNNYSGGLDKTLGISITQVISRDNRDRAEFPTRGSMANWTATLSGGLLGGNEDFQKHVLKLDWYTPTFWKFVLLSSVKVGVIKPFYSSGGQSIIPFAEKFYMGGNGVQYGTMLRGYPENSIGPISSTGRTVGGKTMLKYSTEFRFPFSSSPVVYGMLFAEAGNVWNDSSLLESMNLTRRNTIGFKRTAGIGIRFFMPMIGMLGFDMGYGFDDINGDGNPQGWEYTIIFGSGQ